MSTTDERLQNAQSYDASFTRRHLPLAPVRKDAVLACGDARLDPYGVLGMREGDAHVIILIHQTDCDTLTFTDVEFKRSIQVDSGTKPAWAAAAFPDLDEDVRASVARMRASPFITRERSVRGFVYDVHTGDLREIDPRIAPATCGGRLARVLASAAGRRRVGTASSC